MMRRGIGPLLALAAAQAAMPRTARAADGLACMAEGYSPEELSDIARLSGNFSLEDGADADADSLAQIGISQTFECQQTAGWTDQAMYYAMLYELGRLSAAAFRQSGHLTPDQLRLLDTALAQGDRSQLWALMERGVMAGIEQRDPEFTTQEEFLMGAFVISAGLGSDEAVSEKVGQLLGSMALVRLGQREFDKIAGRP